MAVSRVAPGLFDARRTLPVYLSYCDCQVWWKGDNGVEHLDKARHFQRGTIWMLQYQLFSFAFAWLCPECTKRAPQRHGRRKETDPHGPLTWILTKNAWMKCRKWDLFFVWPHECFTNFPRKSTKQLWKINRSFKILVFKHFLIHLGLDKYRL